MSTSSASSPAAEADAELFLEASRLASSLTRLDLVASAAVEAYCHGQHRALAPGFSSQFRDHRPYQAGDPLKHLDWRVYARTGHTMIRRHQAESNRDALLVLDASASMDYSSAGQEYSKFTYASILAAALALLMQRQGDACGLLTFNKAPLQHLKPASTTRHFQSICQILAATKPIGGSRLEAALSAAANLGRHRGLIVILSDFLDDEPEAALQAMLLLKAAGHQVVLLLICDPAELDFDFIGEHLFQDPEALPGQNALLADPEALRQAYRQAVLDFHTEIAHRCGSAGIPCSLLRTSQSFESALRSIQESRR